MNPVPSLPDAAEGKRGRRRQAALGWAWGLALALGTVWAVTRPLRVHAFWMNYEQDDFFYYLKIAQNLATGHGSTFNGIVPTNGYHPLWMLVLAAVLRSGVGHHGTFLFLAGSIWIATMATYAIVLRILRQAEVQAGLSAVCAAFVAVYCMHLYAECMEVTLAVPLMLAVIAAVQRVQWWGVESSSGGLRCFGMGLLFAAMILSRLDTAIFAALLGAGVLSQRDLRRKLRWQQLTGLSIGCLPVALYGISNRIFFGVWMPISGTAKELKLDHGFSSKAVRTTLELSGTQWLNLIGITLVLLLLPVLWRYLSGMERAIAVATLLFPFVYLASLSWLSDWRIWGWYFYSLRPALCVALLVLFRVPTVQRFATRSPVLVVLALLTLVRIVRMDWDEQGSPMMVAAVEVQQFAKTHPGVYAMGDRAGAVGYLLPDPLVQTEGLVMDRDFLKLITAGTPLREALARYGVRYYIASAMTPYSGCFQAVEPWQAGPLAPHMRGTFCQTPVAHWKHATVETLIFDTSQN